MNITGTLGRLIEQLRSNCLYVNIKINQQLKKFYTAFSEKTAFQMDILEKVHRLTIILEYINSHPGMEEMLVLKGGTAINLPIFNLPRLSVYIDLDFSSDATREEMLAKHNMHPSLIGRMHLL